MPYCKYLPGRLSDSELLFFFFLLANGAPVARSMVIEILSEGLCGER